MDLILLERADRFAASVLSINVEEHSQTEKAIRFTVTADAKVSFWLPKKAIVTDKKTKLKKVAHWFSFDEQTFRRIKDFIENTEIAGGYWQT